MHFFIIRKKQMLTFFYDSLDTLKQVKKPTQQEVIRMSIATFAVMIAASIMFMVFDTFFIKVYSIMYEFLKANIG